MTSCCCTHKKYIKNNNNLKASDLGDLLSTVYTRNHTHKSQIPHPLNATVNWKLYHGHLPLPSRALSDSSSHHVHAVRYWGRRHFPAPPVLSPPVLSFVETAAMKDDNSEVCNTLRVFARLAHCQQLCLSYLPRAASLHCLPFETLLKRRRKQQNKTKTKPETKKTQHNKMSLCHNSGHISSRRVLWCVAPANVKVI